MEYIYVELIIAILAAISLLSTIGDNWKSDNWKTIMDKSQDSSIADSAYGAVSAAELWYSSYLLENEGLVSEEITFGTGSGDKTFSELPIKGEYPTGGKIKISSDGEVSIDNLEINGYKCNYKDDFRSEIECKK